MMINDPSKVILIPSEVKFTPQFCNESYIKKKKPSIKSTKTYNIRFNSELI